MQHQIAFNPMLIAICFFLFTSCNKEEMNIAPSMTPPESSFPESFIQFRSTDFEIYNFMQIEIQRQSVRGGEPSGKLYIGNDEKEYFSDVKSSPIVKLNGKGGGFIYEFGRCHTTFQLTYNIRTHQATGEVICEFDLSESKLHFRLTGNEPVQTIPQFDGPHDVLVFEVELIAATGIFANSSFEMTAFLLDAMELRNPKVDDLNTYLMITGSLN
jgi:hypothetical protein